MGRCKDCKWWSKDAENDPSLHKCLHVMELWDASEWGDNGDGRVLTEKAEGHKAFVQDGSDYMAKLLTRPDFGCVEFERTDE